LTQNIDAKLMESQYMPGVFEHEYTRPAIDQNSQFYCFAAAASRPSGNKKDNQNFVVREENSGRNLSRNLKAGRSEKTGAGSSARGAMKVHNFTFCSACREFIE
jgi:hypothetical protein